MELTVTCFICGQDVDEDVAEAIRAYHAERRRAVV